MAHCRGVRIFSLSLSGILLTMLAVALPLRAERRETRITSIEANELLTDKIEELRAEDDAATEADDFVRAAKASGQIVTLVGKQSGGSSAEFATALSNHAANLRLGGLPAQAEIFDRRALKLRTQILGTAHRDTLNSLNNLAADLNNLGRAAEAEPLDRKVLTSSTRLFGESDPDTLISFTNLAADLHQLGRAAEAEVLNRRALSLSIDAQGEKSPAALVYLSNLAVDLRALGRVAEAEPLDRQALALRTEVFGTNFDTLVSLSNWARDLNLLGRADEAERLDRRSVVLSEQRFGEKHPQTLVSRTNLATDLRALGRPVEAEELDRKTMNIRTKILGAEHPDTIVSFVHLALDIRAMRRPAEAEAMFAHVLTLQTKVMGANHPDTLSSAGDLAWTQLQQPMRASLALPFARRAVEGWKLRRAKLSQDSRDEGQMQRDAQRQSAYFTLLADAAWSAPRTGGVIAPTLRDEAFVALQDALSGSTSRALALSAARSVAEQAKTGLGDVARQRQDLADAWRANEVAQTKTFAQTGPDIHTKRQNLKAEQDRLETAIAASDAQLKGIAPKYYAMIQPAPLNLAAAQALLRPDEAVLMVVPSQFGTNLMVVTKDDLTWQRPDIPADRIDAMVHRLRCDLDPAGEPKCEPTLGVNKGDASVRSAQRVRIGGFDRATAHALYTAVIAPIANAISNKPNLYIVAGGSLASLPFGVLVTEPPTPGTDDGDPDVLRQTHWFEDAHALVQLPSLQSLAYLRTFARLPTRPAADGSTPSFAGYGDPVLAGPPKVRGNRTPGALVSTDAVTLLGTGATQWGAPLMEPSRLRQLARLPGTERELYAMRDALHAPDSALHMAKAMTEAALKAADADGRLARIQILHLATHGIAARELGLAEPGLVFTPPLNASDNDDGYLSTSEVAGLHLSSAEWVILSACNTATPADRGEPGLSGLARAFFYAGAPTLLVSHWPVYDDVAATLTVETLKRAAGVGITRAKALQQAIISVRNDGVPAHAHPAAWAPFALVGEGR